MKGKNGMKNLNKNIKLSLVLLLFTMLALTPAANAAQISTDQEDYGPDEIVYITGTGFNINSVINVTIVGPDGWGTDQFDTLNFPWWVYWSFTEPDRFDIGYLKTKCEGRFYVTATDGTNTATATFTDNKGLVINFAGTGTGSVHVQVDNNQDGDFTDTGDIDETITTGKSYSGSTALNNNADVILTATADVGSTFVDWSGDFDSSTESVSFNMGNSARTETVTFDSVSKITPTLSVTNSPVTYNGSPRAATVEGSVDGTVSDIKYDGSSVAPTNAGTYAITADFAPTDTTNYNSLDDASAGDFVIQKADAIIVVIPYDVTYDVDPHTATGTATGVLGEDLSAGLDLSGTTHTDAGFYAGDPWTFAYANYNDDSGTVDDNIGKADAIIVVTPYDVTYDGNPHTATGTATGVKGEDLNPSGELDLSGTTHTNAGFYAGDPWIFTDSTGNYNDDNGTVDDNIDKATTSLVLTVNPQLLLVGGSFNMQATLSSDDSPSLDLSGMTITFSLDLDPGTGTDLGSENTNGSGVASKNVLTTSWEGNVYTITAVYAGDDNIVGSSDDATVVVAEPGAAATGGGFIADNGRTNFGFTVKMVEGTTNTYKGRFVIVNNGKWRMKGTLDTYGTLDGTGYAGGSGTLYQWVYDGVLEISYWDEVASDVDIMLTFTDTYNGSGTGNTKKTVVLDTFGIQIDYSSVDFDASNPNTDPLSLKGGNIDIKSANNTTDGDPATPPPTGKGKNK